MRKIGIFFILLIVVLISITYFQITGNIVDNSQNNGPGGPSDADMKCMVECTTINCEVTDMNCRTAASTECGSKCGVDVSGAPEPQDEGEKCMQECVVKGCEKFDVACENSNMDKCEDECDMKGDAPDESEMNEEQLCISKCVAKEDPSVICGNSKEGETGNALCQKCADSCVYLYDGPCLNDEEITQKEKECETCENCYGQPVEGPSGQGWDCIVDIKCDDSSEEFGDEPGEGPGIGQEGFVGEVFQGIGSFFKKMFGGKK